MYMYAHYHTLLFYIGGKFQYSHHIYKETRSTRSRILCFVLRPSFKTLYPDDKKPFNSYLLCVLASPCQWKGIYIPLIMKDNPFFLGVQIYTIPPMHNTPHDFQLQLNLLVALLHTVVNRIQRIIQFNTISANSYNRWSDWRPLPEKTRIFQNWYALY